MLTFLYRNPCGAHLIKCRTRQSWPIKCSHCITIRNSIKLWQSFPFIGSYKCRWHAQPILLKGRQTFVRCYILFKPVDITKVVDFIEISPHWQRQLGKYVQHSFLSSHNFSCERLLLSGILPDVGSIHHLSRLKFWHLPAILLATALYIKVRIIKHPPPSLLYSEDNLLHIEQNLDCKGKVQSGKIFQKKKNFFVCLHISVCLFLFLLFEFSDCLCLCLFIQGCFVFLFVVQTLYLCLMVSLIVCLFELVLYLCLLVACIFFVLSKVV